MTDELILDNMFIFGQGDIIGEGLNGGWITPEVETMRAFIENFGSQIVTPTPNETTFSLKDGEMKGLENNFLITEIVEKDDVVFELTNISLKPGETIIIDTDDMDVLFNQISDVSNVTKESDFFELIPGINKLKTELNGGQIYMLAPKITVVWQNRWL